MSRLEEAREFFKADIFATQTTGIVIEEVADGYARCSLETEEKHMAAHHHVMGGALFTMADFAFAVAANGFAEKITVSQHVSMTFLSPAKGRELLAEARCLKAGRTTCLYQVDVRDELGTYVAHGEVNGFTVG